MLPKKIKHKASKAQGKRTRVNTENDDTASPSSKRYNFRARSASKLTIDPRPAREKPQLQAQLFPLLELPNELILLVAENLDVRDLNSLLQTNQRLACLLETRFDQLTIVDAKSGHFQCPWRTKLLWAADKGYTTLVKRLLKYGDNVDFQDGANRTALYMAADNGYKEIVQLLLDHGADVSIRCEARGWTPLHVATTSRLGTVEIVRLLLEKGADPSLEDFEGYTPVHCALRSGKWGGSDITAMMELMLSKGADISLRGNYKGMSPLHHAAYFGDAESVRLLLEYGADVTLQDAQGRTALELATRSEYHAEATGYLLKRWPKSIALPINLPVWYTDQYGEPEGYIRKPGGKQHRTRSKTRYHAENTFCMTLWDGPLDAGCV